MATRTARDRIAPTWLVIWALIGIAAGWFIYDSVVYVATREPQPGATMLNRQIWYYSHMAIAVPILLIAPLQFYARLRNARPDIHHLLGRLFLGSSIAAGILAIWLGATIQYQGSRIPLALFGALWVAFSTAAWACAVKKDYVMHRKFVIRSFALGLAFIWVRILGGLEDQLFPFIDSEEAKDTTQEYLSFILPLLVVETWLTWIPSFRAALRRG